MHFRLSPFLIALFFIIPGYAQESATTDFTGQIKSYDLSVILTADSILLEDRVDKKDKIKRAEIRGFIGDDFQRLQIHFISVIQNPANPLEYYAYGKSRVKKTICSFQGIITIKQARLYTNGDIPEYKQGYTVCEVVLYEDKKQQSTGYFKGQLKSHFIIDHKGEFRYDAIMFAADGFSNNQFVGTWTSYRNSTVKKCHWGDYRIPECGNLDVGAGEFMVNEDYLKNGWETYMTAWLSMKETPEVIEARKKETEQWWR